MRRSLVGIGVLGLLSSAAAFAAPITNNNVVTAVQLTVNGATVQFRQCSEIGTETEVIETTDVKSPNQVTKSPGKTTVPNIVCSRNFSANDTVLSSWRTAVENGQLSSTFKNGSLALIDQNGDTIVTFNFTHGWPSYLKLNAVDVTNPSVPIETISIVVDDINRQ